VVVITGGKDKGTDLSPWADALRARARAAVLIGETAGRLAEALGETAAGQAEDLDAAVAAARALAQPGDIVALIPAASSFDMFADFADRGDRFADAVRRCLAGP
jgi:UDP-N-acetylmuramoylalanine--D-glutamate ligase